MAEHERASRQKQGEADQKHRVRQQESEPSFDKFHGWESSTFSIGESPFLPRMDKHAAILSKAQTDGQRASIALQLQRTYGNRYVQRLIESMGVQAKLTVNAPNDVYEQEADRVADTVTKAIQTPVSRQEEEEEVLQGQLLQRQEEEEEAQLKVSEPQRQEVPEEELQMQPAESKPATVSEDMETTIKAARGGGHPLSDNVRGPMEQALGAGFSGVRVHTDSEADELNQHLSARAFTTGQDIFFRQSEYSPGSDSGRKLIAHELTHVVQQAGTRGLQRDSTQEPAHVESRIPGDSISLKKVKMRLDFVKVKRNATQIAKMILAKLKLAKQPEDPFGHWWTEIGDLDGTDWEPKESYGWWPTIRLKTSTVLKNLRQIFRGVPGKLNAVGGDKDPDHGEKAETEFHPVMEVDEDEEYDTVRQTVTGQIRNFAKGYKGIWNWVFGWGKNCHTFQEELLKAVGLTSEKVGRWLRKPQPPVAPAEPEAIVPADPLVAQIIGIKELKGISENLEYVFDEFFTQRGIALWDLEELSPESRKQLINYLGLSPSKMDEILSSVYTEDVKLFQEQTAPVSVQTKSLLQRQEEEEELQAKPTLQRQADEEEEELQAKPILQRQAEEDDDEEVMAKPASIQRMTPFSGEKDKIVGEHMNGYAIEVNTDAGTPVIGWASEEVFEALVPPEKLEKTKSLVEGKKLTGKEFGESFFCHGFSLGTFGKFGYSVYGDYIHQVLNDEYTYIGDLKSAGNLKRGDIIVIGPLEKPAHSCVVAEDQKGEVDPDTLKTDSKNIFGALEKNYPLKKHMDQYKDYPQITFFRKK